LTKIDFGNITYFSLISILRLRAHSAGEISMARITIEDCLEKVENRYELVHLATKRVKQLRDGAEPLVKSKNKEVVTALREIAAGKIKHAPISEYDSDVF
jgi:DNA-directed RNA polymerase subunit omega